MSSSYPHLRNAPITEALLDIRVVLPAAVTLATLDDFSARVSADFPEVRSMVQDKLEVQLGGRSSSSSTTIGNIYWTVDKSRAVQARLDGFTVNHVGSYAGWEDIRAHARDMWGHYRDVMRPQKIVRCSLRYINKLLLPADQELAGWLRTRPELSPDLPQALEEYFMRLVVPFGDGRKAVITEATDAPRDAPGEQKLILDIDVSATKELDPGSERMWEELDGLREIKNSCFFSSLEQPVWEAYQ